MVPNELQDFYITSPMREGVLCWYPFDRNSSVLDLSGGVLTELLKNRCLRHNEEVKTKQSGKQEQYDYIVIIDPPDFSVEELTNLKNKLTPHGRLLIAYENPFAIRYWSGKSAPNTKLPYNTLFGQGDSPLPSKAEMETRLDLAGFKGQKWYFPLPDHWFATEIYSGSYLPNEHLNHRYLHYVSDDENLQFDEFGLFREVIRNGAFEFMCGSYLIEARVNSCDDPCTVDYAAVTAYRKPAKRFATTVEKNHFVRKKPLHPDGLAALNEMKKNHDYLANLGINILEMNQHDDVLTMPRVDLPILNDYWAGKISKGTFSENEMIAQYDRIRNMIYKAAKDGRCYWEIVPANCFYDEENDEIILFDQEYYSDGISPDVALARAILAFEYSPVLSVNPNSKKWMKRLKERYDLTGNWDELAATAHEKTWKEVVGNGYQPLVHTTIKARKRTEEKRGANKK